jgi:Icc-related predicted phosphoesterase
MKYYFIGDVHGKFSKLEKSLEEISIENEYNKDNFKVIQIGDLGIGFQTIKEPDKFPDNFYFITGNHDDFDKAKIKYKDNCLPNYYYDEEYSIFYIRGAWSIDHKSRTIGKDWWESEELTYSELQKAIDCYLENKPKIVVSHDCPFNSYVETFKFFKDVLTDFSKASRTAAALQIMLNEHAPEFWIHGHHHKRVEYTLNGFNTTFYSLAELDILELNLEE